MLRVKILSVFMLSVIILNVIMLSVFMLNIVIRSVFMLNVILLSFFMLRVVAPQGQLIIALLSNKNICHIQTLYLAYFVRLQIRA
jgi:hypothetical protein